VKRISILALFILAVLFVAYEALIFIDNYASPGRMRETSGVRPHEQPILPMEKGVVPATGGEALYRASAANELKSLLGPRDPGAIQTGRTLYFTYCAQCHGEHQDGNGTVGQSFNPLPTDLRSAKVQSLPEGALFKEISYGVPDGRQPPLATTIEITDRWRIIAYVKSLGLRK
jgi:mono/diheme cytochrome c family protein